MRESVTLDPDELNQVQVRDLVWSGPRRDGWRGDTVGKSILVFKGTKQSPIRSVEFKSEGWKPDVRVLFVVPDKK